MEKISIVSIINNETETLEFYGRITNSDGIERYFQITKEEYDKCLISLGKKKPRLKVPINWIQTELFD